MNTPNTVLVLYLSVRPALPQFTVSDVNELSKIEIYKDTIY